MAPQKPTLWLRVSVSVLIWLCVLAVQPVGADPASEISRIMEAHFQAGEFNGSVLVARGEHIIYQRGLGFANLEWKIPNDPHTKFELGSITKQFTALLVLQFVNEGKVRLAGHVSGYLPYYRKDTGSRITVHHLLSHTSGVPNFIELPVSWREAIVV